MLADSEYTFSAKKRRHSRYLSSVIERFPQSKAIKFVKIWQIFLRTAARCVAQDSGENFLCKKLQKTPDE